MTIQMITGLNGAYYFVTVTDDIVSNCVATGFILVDEPGVTITPVCALSASLSGTNVTTFGGSDGVAVATASGAQGTVSYVWSNGSNTSAISGLTAGSYTVTITDDFAVNCSVVDSISITQPNAIPCNLSVSIVSTDVTTNGGNDGTALAIASGAQGTVTYLWSNSATSAAINSLTANTYMVVVTDDITIGCSETAFVTITEPTISDITEANSFNYTIYPNPSDGKFVMSFGDNDIQGQKMEIIDSRGQIVYSTIINNTSGTLTVDAENLSNGLYYVKLGTTTQRIIVNK